MTLPQNPQSGMSTGKKVGLGCGGCAGAAFIAVVIMMIVGLAIGGSEPDGGPSADGDNGSDSDNGGKADGKVGDTVETGAFAFTVTGMETGVEEVSDDTGYVNETPDGQFVILDITVENISDESGMFDSSSQKLVDADGKEHSTDSKAEITSGAESFLNEINPGNSVNGQLIYDIPADAKPAKVELEGFLSLDSSATVDLT